MLTARRCARTDITAIIRTPARPTATTVLTGLSEARSSVLVRGSMAPAGSETGVGRMDGAAVRGTVIRDGVVAGTVVQAMAIVADTVATAMSIVATQPGVMPAEATPAGAMRAVASMAHQAFGVVAGSMAMPFMVEVGSTVAEGPMAIPSMVGVATEVEGSTVVAAMAEGVAKILNLG